MQYLAQDISKSIRNLKKNILHTFYMNIFSLVFQLMSADVS